MSHATQADELFEILRDELGSVVADNPRRLIGELFFGTLEDRFNVLFSHRFADFPMNNEPAVPVQNAAHVVKSAAQVQIRDIDVPMFVWTARLMKTLSFACRFHVVPVEDACRFQYPINARCADRNDVGVKHFVREPSIAIERMLPVKIENRSLFPVFEPMVAWNPAVVFVYLSVTLLPAVKGAFWHADPAEDAMGRNLAPALPMLHIVDDAIAYVVGNPDSV